MMALHTHVCSQCRGPFDCDKPTCEVDDRWAVCPKIACVTRWEKEDEDEEKHSAACVCQDCCTSDYNADDLRAGEPSRA